MVRRANRDVNIKKMSPVTFSSRARLRSCVAAAGGFLLCFYGTGLQAVLGRRLDFLAAARRRNMSNLVNIPHSPLTLLQLSADSPCSAHNGSESDCLGTSDAQCMFLELESKALCLPCTFGAAANVNIPCPPENSVFAMETVKACKMACAHQNVLTKVSECTDVDSDGPRQISQSQCMSKGDASEVSCMWIQYKMASGKTKSMCGPCNVGGIGKVACYGAEYPGPEAGSSVIDCVSQCDLESTANGIPCGGGVPGVTPCFVTPAPPEPIPVTGVEAYGVKPLDGAPEYFAATVPAPFSPAEFKAAAKAAAKAAGWYPDTKLPPETPVMVWGGAPENSTGLPMEVSPYWGPAPPGLPDMPLPGTGFMGVLPNEPKPA
eukprot:g12043.t1